DPIQLDDTGRRQQPVQVAAEADEADAVLPLEIAVGERRGRANREVERRLLMLTRLDEGVEEDDHVGVALGVRFVHPELAAARGRGGAPARRAPAPTASWRSGGGRRSPSRLPTCARPGGR